MVQNRRITYIDGLRGIAILAVVLFHAYSHWEAIEPFKQADYVRYFFGVNPFGATLFMTISGYIVYMNLQKKDNLLMFSVNAYLRLAPTAIIISLLLLFTSPLIPERPGGALFIQDMLPSITLIDPYILTKLLGTPIHNVEDSFWFLFATVKFYACSSIMFFLLKDKKMVGLFLIYLFYLFLRWHQAFGFVEQPLSAIYGILSILGFNYFGTFLIGVFSYQWANRQHNNTWLPAALLLSIILIQSIVFEIVMMRTLVVFWTAIFLFILPIFSDKTQQFLSNNTFKFFGFISYPLFLVHENLVTGLAIQLHQSGVQLPSFCYPLPFILLVMGLSYIVALLEPNIRQMIIRWVPKTIGSIPIIENKHKKKIK